MKKKTLAGILLTAAVSSLFVSSAWAKGWERDGDRYRYKGLGDVYHRDSIRQVDKKFYGFDAEGYMLKGWAELSGKKYYFSPEDGVQVLGWMEFEGKWYYLDPKDGHLHLGGPERIGDKLYYFRWDDGAMRDNEIFCDCDSDDGKGEHGRNFYQADADGALRCNQEEHNPKDPYDLVKYDENGRIIAFNKQISRMERLQCENDEHVKNSKYYQEKYK